MLALDTLEFIENYIDSFIELESWPRKGLLPDMSVVNEKVRRIEERTL